MPIQAQINQNYNPISPLVSEKYTPLTGITVDDSVFTLIKNRVYTFPLLSYKLEWLIDFKIQSDSKTTSTSSKSKKESGGTGADNPKVPIVVISSNRSKWIKNRLDTATEILNQLGQKEFKDVNDINALSKENLQKIGIYNNHDPLYGPTLWYDPRRVNDKNHPVFIIVHELEYKTYVQALEEYKEIGIQVIGWGLSSDKLPPLVGFGASRFAAIEFCKKIGCSKAWLVDDNMVYVKGFSKFKDTENKIISPSQSKKDKPSEIHLGIGFGSTTKNESLESIEEQVKKTVSVSSIKENPIAFLQQCVLWNIDLMSKENLNFSPYFITSGEDSSFSTILSPEKEKSGLVEISGTGIIKGIVSEHDGEEEVAKARNKILELFYKIEQDYPLSDGITLGALLEKGFKSKDWWQEGQKYSTQSKAIEQLMIQALKTEKEGIRKGALDMLFLEK